MPSESDAPKSEPVVIHATIANHTPGPSDPPRHGLSLLVDLVKGIVWPLLALTFFLIFREPIRRTIVLVPDKLEKADKANIGSLSWEIQQRAKEQGGSDLAARVGALSPAAIEELISTSRYSSVGFLSTYEDPQGSRGYTIPSDTRLKGFEELESAQLLKFRQPLADWLDFFRSVPVRDDPSVKIPFGRTVIPLQPLTPEQRRRIELQSYELTPKGTQAVEAIVKAIGEQLRVQ
jgi:hypothetical protein